jgi:anti-sigma factor (TIGR02949 family)
MSADPCAGAEHLLQPYLDRALTASEVLRIEEHLVRCSYCNDRYVFERALREQLKSCCSQEHAPPGLVERVRLRCRQADCS